MKKDERFTEMRRAIERDAARLGRPHDHRGLLRAIGLIGSVGWPIAILTGAGAIVGNWIDRRTGSGVFATLGLLVLGAIVGSFIAARSLREGSSR